jgi:GT2 family glycosyltransferase
MNPKVIIITLNWNGWHDTIECLESLNQIDYEDYEVILVDNASSDESLARIDAYCASERKFESHSAQYVVRGKPITVAPYSEMSTQTREDREREGAHIPSENALTLIKNDRNYGFAEGNNIAVAYALNVLDLDYVLLLNNDTVVDRRFLNELVNSAEQDAQIGVIQPKMLYYKDSIVDNTGIMTDTFTATARRGSYEKDEGQYDNHRKKGFFYASGACVLVKKSLLLALSGECFDPYLFAYGEDLDLSWMARLMGFSIVYCPESVCYHKVGATFGSGRKNPYVAYLSGRNRLRIMIKNYSLLTLVFVLPLFIALSSFMSLANCILYSDLSYLSGFVRGLLWNVANLNSALVRRRSIQVQRTLCDKEIMNHMASYSLQIRAVLERLGKRKANKL